MTHKDKVDLELIIGAYISGWCLSNAISYFIGSELSTVLTLTMLLACTIYIAVQAWRRYQHTNTNTSPTMCETCLARARSSRLHAVWAYPSGHIMDTVKPPRTLSEWPTEATITTFCGLPITGKESSRYYRL